MPCAGVLWPLTTRAAFSKLSLLSRLKATAVPAVVVAWSSTMSATGAMFSSAVLITGVPIRPSVRRRPSVSEPL